MLTEKIEVAEPTYEEMTAPDPERQAWDSQNDLWEEAVDYSDRRWMPDPTGQPYWLTLMQLDDFLSSCRRLSPGYTWYIDENTHGRQRSEVAPTPMEAGYFAPERIWSTFRAVGISVGHPVRHADQAANVDCPVIGRIRIWDDSLNWVFVDDLLYDQEFCDVQQRSVLDAFEVRFVGVRNLPVGQISKEWTTIKVLEGLGAEIPPYDGLQWGEVATVQRFLAMDPPEHDRATWLKENVGWVSYRIKRDYVQRNLLPSIPAQVSELVQLEADLTLEATRRREKMIAEALTKGMDLATWFADILARLEKDDLSAVAYVRNLKHRGIMNAGEVEGFLSGIVPVFMVGNRLLP